jgi:hypothetical protein
VEQRGQSQQLLPFVDDRDAVALRFLDEDSSNRAVEILLHEAYGHPAYLPDNMTIIINRSDQHFFDGLAYEEQKVAHPDEVSLQDLARIRAEHMRGE